MSLGVVGSLGCGLGGRPDVYTGSTDIQFTRVEGGVMLPDGFIIFDDVPLSDTPRVDTSTDVPPVDATATDLGESGLTDAVTAMDAFDAGAAIDVATDVPTDMVDAAMEDVERCTPMMTRFCAPSPGIPETVYGRGQCRRGTQTCNAMGRWDDCQGQVDPRPGGETCNGVDDNCDGIVDNLYRECGNGPCRVRRLVCVLGREVMCEPNTAMRRSELCNGADDDCDGFVDEREDNTGNLSESCFTYPPEFNGRGICRSGTRTCADAGWSPCDDTIPQPEQCNGLDDDCDGTIDNACTDR